MRRAFEESYSPFWEIWVGVDEENPGPFCKSATVQFRNPKKESRLCEKVLVKFEKPKSSHFDFILICSKLGFLPTRHFRRDRGVELTFY